MTALTKVYVITATYNEAPNLRQLHRRLREAVPEAHWVIVDDGSPDGTAALARELQATDARLHVIDRGSKLGYASAHQTGMKAAIEAGAGCIVTMDGDLSHDPAAIPQMVAALGEYDVVIGSRYAPGGGFDGVSKFRRMLSRFANLYVRALLRIPAQDCTSGFRAYRADIISRSGMLQEGPQGYVFLTEALWLCLGAGARLGEVPIKYMARGKGRSKMSARIILESAWRTLMLRFPRLLKSAGRRRATTQ